MERSGSGITGPKAVFGLPNQNLCAAYKPVENRSLGSAFGPWLRRCTLWPAAQSLVGYGLLFMEVTRAVAKKNKRIGEHHSFAKPNMFSRLTVVLRKPTVGRKTLVS